MYEHMETHTYTHTMFNVLTSLTLTEPFKTVPVITVPCPLIGKQWSTEYISGPSGER